MAEHSAFERRFLTSPQRRSKVDFARALAVVTKQAPAPPAWRSLLRVFRGWTPTLRYAAAFAALICAAGVTWLILQNAATNARMAAVEAERRALEQQREGLRRQQAAQAVEPPKQEPSSRPPAPLVASLVLFSGLTRSDTAPAQLVLGPAVQRAHIEIQLEPRDDYPNFRIQLRTRGGAEVLTRDSLHRRRAGAGSVVSFDVEADTLRAGQYELALQGIPDGAPAEDVTYCYFNVVIRR
jgi:hypothetical protein